MGKYIDAEKLKSIIKVQIKERKEWMKDIDRSDRQDQLWSDLNGEDTHTLQIISSLQQEQQEMDLEKEIETYFKGWYMDETDQGYILHTPDEHAGLMSVKQIARHFYELARQKYEK